MTYGNFLEELSRLRGKFAIINGFIRTNDSNELCPVAAIETLETGEHASNSDDYLGDAIGLDGLLAQDIADAADAAICHDPDTAKIRVDLLRVLGLSEAA